MAVSPEDQRTMEVVVQARNATQPGLAAAAASVQGFNSQVTRASDVLLQQQVSRERQVEQMLLNKGITAGPGASSLSKKELSALGLTESELSSLGMGGAARAGGNQYERVLAGRMAGLGGAANLMGFSGPMLAVGAAAMGIGAGAAAVGDLVKTYREHEQAVKDITQAYGEQGLNVDAAKTSIEKWIDTNAPYIQNVNDAREGFATLTRSGLTQAQVMMGMNDALNLASLKHITLSQAVEQTTLLTQGSGKGLKDLGIQVKDYTDLTISGAQAAKQVEAAHNKVATASEALTNAQRALKEDQQRLHDKAYITENDRMHEQDLIEKVNDANQKYKDAQLNLANVQKAVTGRQQEVNQALGDLGAKVKGGTDTVDSLQRAQDKFGIVVDKLATDVGPALLTALTAVVSGLDGVAGMIHTLISHPNQGLLSYTPPGNAPGHWAPIPGTRASRWVRDPSQGLGNIGW